MSDHKFEISFWVKIKRPKLSWDHRCRVVEACSWPFIDGNGRRPSPLVIPLGKVEQPLLDERVGAVCKVADQIGLTSDFNSKIPRQFYSALSK